MSVYETARKLQLPGLEITAVVNPALLTARIRNAAMRMIDKGVITGWGQAAKLARLLMESHDEPYIRDGRASWLYASVRNCKSIPDNFRAKLQEASDADISIYKMELIEEINKYPNEWRKRELDNLNKGLEPRAFTFNPENHTLFFSARSKAAKSLFEPIVLEYLDAGREGRRKYSAMLLGTTPIPVKF